MSSKFCNDPLWYIRDAERPQAVEALRSYFAAFTGANFESLADHDNPDAITARDLVAVTMLGVAVPPRATVWILGEGSRTIATLLAQVPASPDALWTDPSALARHGPAWRLYYRLRTLDRVGRTRASKLLAAKRPHLLPIYDAVVADALKIGDDDDDWAAWQATLAAPSVRSEVTGVRDEVAAAAHLSLLRTLDIVIWMRHRTTAL